jgi:dephospho-CoA kinase
MRKLLLCLVGMPGSGKSTVKDAILKNFRAAGISSGDIIRAEVKRRGMEYSPHTDMAIAHWFHTGGREVLIVQRTWERLKRSRKPILVVDGFRSYQAVEMLGRISGLKQIVIAVTAPFSVRFKRELARGRFGHGESKEYLKKRDELETQHGVRKVIRRADFSINNSKLTAEQTAKRAILLVRRLKKRYKIR